MKGDKTTMPIIRKYIQFDPIRDTQVPNIIIDYWMTKLSSLSFKILMLLYRRTYRTIKTITISKNQLVEVSGLCKNSVSKAFKELEHMKLISIHQNKDEYGTHANSYSICTDEILVDILEKGE